MEIHQSHKLFTFVLKTIGTMIVLAFGGVLPGAVSAADSVTEYEYIRDNNGRILGAIWEKWGQQVSGQLARHKSKHFLLFVACNKFQILADEEFIKRTTRNCSGDFAAWPENLLTHVTVALAKPIVLTGPPSTCGACMPAGQGPMDDLPPDVDYDPFILNEFQGNLIVRFAPDTREAQFQRYWEDRSYNELFDLADKHPHLRDEYNARVPWMIQQLPDNDPAVGDFLQRYKSIELNSSTDWIIHSSPVSEGSDLNSSGNQPATESPSILSPELSPSPSFGVGAGGIGGGMGGGFSN